MFTVWHWIWPFTFTKNRNAMLRRLIRKYSIKPVWFHVDFAGLRSASLVMSNSHFLLIEDILNNSLWKILSIAKFAGSLQNNLLFVLLILRLYTSLSWLEWLFHSTLSVVSPVPHAYVHLYCFLLLSTLLLVSSSVPPYLLHHLFLICHSSINHPSCPQISSIGLPLPLPACPVDHCLSPPSVRLRLSAFLLPPLVASLHYIHTYIQVYVYLLKGL